MNTFSPTTLTVNSTASFYSFYETTENKAVTSVLTVTYLFIFILSPFLLIKYNQAKGKDEKVLKKVKKKFYTKKKITTATIPQAKHLLPVRLPYIDGFYTLYRLQKDGIRILEEWIPEYGGLFEIPLGAITVFAVSEASIIQKILLSSNPRHLNKPGYIYDKIFVDCMADGLVNSKYETWTHHRKMLSRAFMYKSLQTYLKFMNLHASNLAKGLSSECSKSEETEGSQRNSSVEGEAVWKLLYFYATKIITHLVMGSGRVSDEETAQFNHDFVNFKHAVLERLTRPQLQIKPYWHFHWKRKEYERLSNACDIFYDKAIQAYRKEYEEMKAEKMIKVISDEGDESDSEEVIEVDEKGNNAVDNNNDNDIGEKPFRCLIEEMLHRNATNKEIYDEFGTFINAGHETTVTALQLLMVHLALNPYHQDRCREEVDALFAAKTENNNGSFDGDLNMDDLTNLKYLERCILESGRVTPTIPMFLRSVDVPLKINKDLELRAGSTVAILPWMLHRDPEHFPGPEKFNPDRFLPENVKSRHPYAFVPFSSGPRNCIGWKVALMEMKVIMTQILQNFEIYTTDKIEDVKLLFEVTLLPERNYNIILKQRAF